MTDFAPRGFLFDCDGVLVDSLENAAQAWDRWSVVHAPHFDFRRDVVHGRRAGDTVAELVAPEHRAAAERELELLEIEVAGSTVEITGAGGLVRSLPSGSWCVVTSGIRELALARLSAAGLPRPTNLVAAEDVTFGKPDPEPYARGAAVIGVAPADCVVFEDAPAGIQSALDAGVGVIIGVGRGAIGAGATCVVPDLAAVTFVNGVLRADDALLLG